MNIENTNPCTNISPKNTNVSDVAGNKVQNKISIFCDKNNNGIIDEGDFSQQEWNTVSNSITRFFDGQKWTQALSNLFAKIFNRVDSKNIKIEEPLTIISDAGRNQKSSMIFDDETRTLKIAQRLNDLEYSDYKEVKYDDEGNVVSTKDYTRNKYFHSSRDKVYLFSQSQLSEYLVTLGFPTLSERKFSDEEVAAYMNMAGPRIWDYINGGGSNGSIAVPYSEGLYVVFNSGENEVYDINDKLILKTIKHEGYDEVKNYDDQGQVLRTVIRTVDDSGTVTDKIEEASGNKYIFQYSSVDINRFGFSNPNNKRVILLDKNDKPVVMYDAERVLSPSEDGRKYCETRKYQDGHVETVNLDKDMNVID